ncbi:MAG: DUF937 domain-containing protein [Cytophagales bacterium]|nr:DUF937 domain-containing protein [Cytophagales bacterium]
MLENLINLVKDHALDAVVNNPAVPNANNEDVINETASSIISGLKDHVSAGNLGDVMGLLQGNHSVASLASNPAVTAIIGTLASNLESKFGLPSSVTNNVANQLIPTVMNQLITKVKDSNDSSFDLQSILSAVSSSGLDAGGLLGSLTGGSSEGLGGMLGGLFGK